jgi:ribokinase
MTIWNLGSVNADLVYAVPHLPGPGETLAATSMTRGLGGKGANMSVAAARAGAQVMHIGALGADGAWARDRLQDYGVDTSHIATLDQPMGHAVIAVDRKGENSILLFPGANVEIAQSTVRDALAQAVPGDTVLIQNETNNQAFCAETGSKLGLRVAYAAAPFDAQAVASVLPCLDFLILNEVEAEQLFAATGKRPADLDVTDVIVTLGARGCSWFDNANHSQRDFDALKVAPVDTTGAGDTFTGYVLAGLDAGLSMEEAIAQATRAGALMVTRAGAADVIPTLSEVRAAPF